MLCLPWPLTAHWHPPISQWETLTVRREITREGGRENEFLLLMCYHPTISTGDRQMSSRWDIKRWPEQNPWARTHTHGQTHPSLCQLDTCVNKHGVIFSSDVCNDSPAVLCGFLDDLLVQRLWLGEWITRFIMIWYVSSLDNCMIFANISKSAMILFRFSWIWFYSIRFRGLWGIVSITW